MTCRRSCRSCARTPASNLMLMIIRIMICNRALTALQVRIMGHRNTAPAKSCFVSRNWWAAICGVPSDSIRLGRLVLHLTSSLRRAIAPDWHVARSRPHVPCMHCRNFDRPKKGDPCLSLQRGSLADVSAPQRHVCTL